MRLFIKLWSIFVKRSNFKSFVSKEVTHVGFDLCHRQFWKCMSVSYILHDVYRNRCKCINCSLENVVQHEECRCCIEVDRCRERRAEIE